MKTDSKKSNYEPVRIKSSNIKILYTPIEYINAGREVMDELVKKRNGAIADVKKEKVASS